MSMFQKNEALLRECLPWLRETLFGIIECDSFLVTNATGEIEPRPNTMGEESRTEARELISLIRSIEAQVGTQSPSPGPDWLDDVIDGRGDWSYLVPTRSSHAH